MNNNNWLDSFGVGSGGNSGQNAWNFGQNAWNNAQELPTRTSPTQYGQPQVSPTQQFVQRNVSNTVVPHYHPSHLTTINQHMINNQHYFPHTESVVNECYETNTMCGKPFHPPGCGCNKRRRW